MPQWFCFTSKTFSEPVTVPDWLSGVTSRHFLLDGDLLPFEMQTPVKPWQKETTSTTENTFFIYNTLACPPLFLQSVLTFHFFPRVFFCTSFVCYQLLVCIICELCANLLSSRQKQPSMQSYPGWWHRWWDWPLLYGPAPEQRDTLAPAQRRAYSKCAILTLL